MKNVKFDSVITDCIVKMRESEFMQEEKEKKNVIGRIIECVGKLCCEKQKEKGKRSIYDVVIPKLTYDNLEIHAGNMIYGNRGMVTNGIAGVNSEDKTAALELGKYTHYASKWALFEAIPFNMHLVFGQLTDAFRARYYYLLLQAIGQMDVEEQHLSPDKFGVYLQQLVKDKGEDYMLIDCNSAMTSFMKYDKHDRDDDEDWYRHVTTYLKANVQHLDIETSDFLRDLKEVREFQGMLLIIKQKDIPYLDAIVAGERCKLNYEEIIDKRRAIADMKITVDSNYLIRYNKKAKVIKVFTEKMNLK